MVQILHSIGPRSLGVAATNRRMYRTNCRTTQTVYSGTSRSTVGANTVIPQGIAVIPLQLSLEGCSVCYSLQ